MRFEKDGTVIYTQEEAKSIIKYTHLKDEVDFRVKLIEVLEKINKNLEKLNEVEEK